MEDITSTSHVSLGLLSNVSVVTGTEIPFSMPGDLFLILCSPVLWIRILPDLQLGLPE